MVNLAFSLRQIHYFVAVAETGQMRAAAQRVHLSEAALSSAISDLESELGVQLVLRKKSRGAKLTPLGESMLAEAREILLRAERFQERARGEGHSLTGRLSIGIYTTLAPFLLPGILEQFSRAQPNVTLDVQEGSLPELQSALRNGSCELALLYDVDIARDMMTQPLFAIAPSVLLGKDHPLAKKPNLRLAHMGNEPMILLDVPPSRQRVEEILRLSGIAPPIRYRSPNFELVRALVGRGEGFAIMYQLPVSNLTYDGHELVARRLDLSKHAVSVVLCASKDYKPTARARAFNIFCQQSISSPPASR